MHIETLQSRPMDEQKKQEFYRLMHEDTGRLILTVDQVLRAAESKQSNQKHWSALALNDIVLECVEEIRKRYGLGSEQLDIVALPSDSGATMIMLINNAVAHVDIHFAKTGCFAARAIRAIR